MKNAGKVESSDLLASKQFIHRKLILFRLHSFLILPVYIELFFIYEGLSVFVLDVERAVRILDGFEHYAQKGVGAFNLDGKMYV